MNEENNKYEDTREAYERVRNIKSNYQDELLGKPNVVGLGVGLRQRAGEQTNEIVLVVMVSKKIPSIQLTPAELIPLEIEGVPVDVQEVGEITIHEG